MAWIPVALWMFALAGHAAALPLISGLRIEDLGLDLLGEVSCGEDITFTSPINKKAECYEAKLGHFIKEFQVALVNCTDNQHIEQTVEELERVYLGTPAECNLTKTVHKTFADFVEAAKHFAESFNSARSQRMSQN